MAARRAIAKPGALRDEHEIEAVLEVLRTSTLDLGPKVDEMERRTAALLSKQHGVMVNSGSSALRLAIDLLRGAVGDRPRARRPPRAEGGRGLLRRPRRMAPRQPHRHAQ